MKREFLFLILLTLLTLLTSCIDRIDLGEDVADQYRRQLYIEGRILSGATSVFYVQHTIPMTQTKREYVEEAELHIVSDQGFVSDAAVWNEDDKSYAIPTGTLNDTERYKLVAKVDGETYESDFLTLQPSLPIDEVWFTEHPRENIGHNLWSNDHIDIHVKTHGDDDAARHYMWTWEEDFEYHVPYDISLVHGPLPDGVFPYYDASVWEGLEQHKTNPYYYCWKHGQSSDYRLYSTENLAQNVVNDVVIASFEKQPTMMGGPSVNQLSPRFSYLYSITVHQSTLDSAAYSYYHQMEQYTEEMGGLFSPTPYDLYGNLQCTSNPELRVRGNITASEVSSYRLFVPREEVHLKTDYDPVPPLDLDTYYGNIDVIQLLSQGHAFGTIGPPSNSGGKTKLKYLFYRPCINCLSVEGATKQKPEWWPTDDE